MAQSLCNVDIIIGSILTISVLVGFFRGAIKEILTVVSWIGAVLLTILLFPIGKNIISTVIQQPLLVDLVTYIVVFVVFLVILSSFTCLFSSIVKSSALAVPNRLCGGLFGILRGLLLLAILDFGISQFILQDYTEYVKESKLRPYVKETSKMIFIMLPENLRQSLLKHLSLEQQKALLDNFNINNDENNIQTIAKQDNNINVNSSKTENNNVSKDNKDNTKTNNGTKDNKDKPSIGKLKEILQDNKDKSNKFDSRSDTKNTKKGQTAQELSELKVQKESDPSNFFKDTKKDLDKLLDTYT